MVRLTPAHRRPAAVRPRLHHRVRVGRDHASGRMLLLGPSGAMAVDRTALRVIVLCDGRHEVSAIVERMAARQPAASRAEVARVVGAFLADLAAVGLLDADV